MSVGMSMKIRRKQLHMSAETLAEKLGLSPATIYRYESGFIEKIDSAKLIPIADALQTTPAWLMGFSDEKGSPDPDISEIEFALSGEIHELTEDEMQDVLDYVRFKRSQKSRQEAKP